MLRLCIPPCRTLSEQLDTPVDALRDIFALSVENPKVGHGLCVTKTSRLLVPLDSLLVVLRQRTGRRLLDLGSEIERRSHRMGQALP